MSCDFVVVAKNPLTLLFRSFDDWHDCQGTRWKQAASNQGPWPYWRGQRGLQKRERCVSASKNQGTSVSGTKPFCIRKKNAHTQHFVFQNFRAWPGRKRNVAYVEIIPDGDDTQRSFSVERTPGYLMVLDVRVLRTERCVLVLSHKPGLLRMFPQIWKV